MQQMKNLSRRSCNKNPNNFCYVCGLYTPKKFTRSMSNAIRKSYHELFGVHIQDQTKVWAPHVTCDRCYHALLTKTPLPFVFPMVWFEPMGHNDCYFCMSNTKGYTMKTRKLIKYPHVTSVKLPIYERKSTAQTEIADISSCSSDIESENEEDVDDADGSAYGSGNISQSQMDLIVRKLKLSKSDSQKLGKMLRSFDVLQPKTTYSHYRLRHLQFSVFFAKQQSVVFCKDILGLLNELHFDGDIKNWWIFMDSSSSSLKVVLLHRTSQHPAIPIVYARNIGESYESVKNVCALISYDNLQLQVCGDLKMVGILMGLQPGYIKNMCFLCLWDSRCKSNQYKHERWPLRENMISGINNVKYEPLIPSGNVLLPPLHIKLGIFKQFIKSLSSVTAKNYLSKIFPKISEAKLKEGIFVGPQLRKLLRQSETFAQLLNEPEKKAWYAMVLVIKGFLGKNRALNYRQLVSDMMDAFDNQSVRMSLKLHFLHDHLDFFHSDFGSITDEHGERFHQTMATIENRYAGRSDERMMGDFCWLLMDK